METLPPEKSRASRWAFALGVAGVLLAAGLGASWFWREELFRVAFHNRQLWAMRILLEVDPTLAETPSGQKSISHGLSYAFHRKRYVKTIASPNFSRIKFPSEMPIYLQGDKDFSYISIALYNEDAESALLIAKKGFIREDNILSVINMRDNATTLTLLEKYGKSNKIYATRAFKNAVRSYNGNMARSIANNFTIDEIELLRTWPWQEVDFNLEEWARAGSLGVVDYIFSCEDKWMPGPDYIPASDSLEDLIYIANISDCQNILAMLEEAKARNLAAFSP